MKALRREMGRPRAQRELEAGRCLLWYGCAPDPVRIYACRSRALPWRVAHDAFACATNTPCTGTIDSPHSSSYARLLCSIGALQDNVPDFGEASRGAAADYSCHSGYLRRRLRLYARYGLPARSAHPTRKPVSPTANESHDVLPGRGRAKAVPRQDPLGECPLLISESEGMNVAFGCCSSAVGRGSDLVPWHVKDSHQ